MQKIKNLMQQYNKTLLKKNNYDYIAKKKKKKKIYIYIYIYRKK